MDGSNRDGRRKPSKKRSPSRGTITLGGLKKVEKARKRRVKQRLMKKKGEMNIHEGGKRIRTGPPPPNIGLVPVCCVADRLSRLEMFQATICMVICVFGTINSNYLGFGAGTTH